jgi:tRNA A-37 threonylcarbamoyl transferase component Bud32
MLGSVIANRYRPEAVIGEGGVAVVYRGTDLTLDRRVAIKVLRPELAEQPEVVSRFRREAHAAAKLNHGNIVQVYDTGVDEGRYYIVMEYLPEPNLKQIMMEYAPLPVHKVVEIGIQCCQGLAYAHNAGIVHRDVKPHNILFTDDGRVKLSDFGIAAAAGAWGLTGEGKVLGSAHYISPEQAQGAPAGPLSDVYSLGVVLYEALTGRTPFDGENAADIAAQHLREKPPSPRMLNPAITPSMEFIVSKAMAADAQRRYRSADEMLNDLRKVERGEDLDQTGVLPQTPEATLPLTRMTAGPAAEQRAVAEPVAPRSAAAAEPAASPAQGVLAGVGLGLLVLIVVIGAAWLVKVTFYGGAPPKKLEVPNVKGMTKEEARRELEGRGLAMGRGDLAFDEDSREGTIIDQHPPPGETVEEGTAVDLVISQGRETVSVMAVTGMTLERAEVLLESKGLHVGEVKELFHDTAPKGTVFDQEIKPGTVVNTGTDIGLSVSNGPEVTEPTEEPTEEPGPGETTPGGTEEPGVTVPEDPHVEVREETPNPDDPALRLFHVKVTAMGDAPNQSIRVQWRDKRGGMTVEHNETHQPGQSKEIVIRARGPITIEVYKNDILRYQDPFPVPETEEEPE